MSSPARKAPLSLVPAVADLDVATVLANMPHYEAHYERLTGNVITIQAQMANRHRLGPEGVPLDDCAFQAWKGRAMFAMQAMIREKRALKILLHQARLELDALGCHAQVVTDRPALVLSMQQTVTKLRKQLTALSTCVEADEDFTDLLECLGESLPDLQAYLTAMEG